MKYRKKPVVIEAYVTEDPVDIETLEGTMHANPGDYIITGVNGEQYPCKPDIFMKTYEPADSSTFQVDRDALLALADELEEDACWEIQTQSDTTAVWRLKDTCDRIREALGVEHV